MAALWILTKGHKIVHIQGLKPGILDSETIKPYDHYIYIINTAHYYSSIKMGSNDL